MKIIILDFWNSLLIYSVLFIIGLCAWLLFHHYVLRGVEE